MPNTFYTYPITGEKKLSAVDKKIMDYLSLGELISGEQIGELIGTSRAYVWKRIAALKERGLEVLSFHGEGYRLPPGSEALSEELLSRCIDRNDLHLRACWILPSTNLAALELAEQFPLKEFILLAESQTQGRGRRGKDWCSPLGGDLYMSYKVPFDSGAKSLQGLSLVVGVAIVEALITLTGSEELALKWPNDIYYQGRKLGGVLIEMTGDINGDCDAIIGVGINSSFSGDAEQPVASISEILPAKMNRNHWIADIVNAISASVVKFKEEGLVPFIDKWSTYDFLLQQKVSVLLGNEVVTGKAVGINGNGALLVERGAGSVETFYAGEVSVRKQ